MFLVISRALFKARIVLELFIDWSLHEIQNFRTMKPQVKNFTFTIPSDIDRVGIQYPLGTLFNNLRVSWSFSIEPLTIVQNLVRHVLEPNCQDTFWHQILQKRSFHERVQINVRLRLQSATSQNSYILVSKVPCIRFPWQIKLIGYAVFLFCFHHQKH